MYLDIIYFDSRANRKAGGGGLRKNADAGRIGPLMSVVKDR